MAKIIKKKYFPTILNDIIKASYSSRTACLPAILRFNIKSSNSDMLYSLRQSTGSSQPHTPLSCTSSLAGDPKTITECCHTYRAEVFEKWNQKPKRDNSQWLKYFTL